MIDKSCQGEGATHYACSCVLERLAKLEAVARAATLIFNCETSNDVEITNLKQALSALAGEEKLG